VIRTAAPSPGMEGRRCRCGSNPPARCRVSLHRTAERGARGGAHLWQHGCVVALGSPSCRGRPFSWPLPLEPQQPARVGQTHPSQGHLRHWRFSLRTPAAPQLRGGRLFACGPPQPFATTQKPPDERSRRAVCAWTYRPGNRPGRGYAPAMRSGYTPDGAGKIWRFPGRLGSCVMRHRRARSDAHHTSPGRICLSQPERVTVRARPRRPVPRRPVEWR
jgi:hypothetical protein